MNGDIAHAAATTREQRISQLCDQYVRAARNAYAAGRPGYGEFLLARLGLKLARLIGEAVSVELLEDLVFVQVGDQVSAVESIGAES